MIRHRPSFPHFTSIFILLVLAISLQACNFPGYAERFSAPTPTSAIPATPAPFQEALVVFEVQVPEDSPPNEPVFLSVLDEVTGLALNNERHEMESDGDNRYSLSLPFRVGSVIKYRYARQGTYLTEEHTTDQSPVRYRLFLVDGPGTVQDVVSAWSDTFYEGPSGRIMGKVTDAENNLPVPGLLIAAGGAQTLSASDGTFILEGLPPGTHNMVAYATDGAYRTFQQGAVVADLSTTPASFQITPTPVVKVTFLVSVPQETLPNIPVRLAGNLSQLGNTFADLSGGVSTLAIRMPILKSLPDGRYSAELTLPAGVDIQYKYTLGDGFWNAEHTPSGEFRLRNVILPETNTVIEDQVDSWSSGSTAGPLLFDLHVPDSTPSEDYISIQFNPFGWTEPIPMWSLGENRWVYVLYSPLSPSENFSYRYCRVDQCGSADDAQTPGNQTVGRVTEISTGNQTIEDVVQSWAWWDIAPDQPPIETEVIPRSEDFIRGVELQPSYHPSWTPRQPFTFDRVHSVGANWVVLTPTWTYSRQAPPLLEPVTGHTPPWNDIVGGIEQARDAGLNIALFPTAVFPFDSDEWWINAPRDFAWWLVWFERYRTFVLDYADLATRHGAQVLILGGDWLTPALPGGTLPDGSPSGVPLDAEQRWRSLISEVRNRFPGDLAWALPAESDGLHPPPFMDQIDQTYLLWSTPLSTDPASSIDNLRDTASEYMVTHVIPFTNNVDKPIIIAIAYPSATGGVTGCLPDPMAVTEGDCLEFDQLSRPNPDISSIPLDLEEQSRIYQAVLEAININDWIDGVVSRGYYPPAVLQDKSVSLNGKPAEDVLKYFYSKFLPTP